MMSSETLIMFLVAAAFVLLAVSRLFCVGSFKHGHFFDTTRYVAEVAAENTFERNWHGAVDQMGTVYDVEDQDVIGAESIPCGVSKCPAESTEFLLNRTVSRLKYLLQHGSKSLRFRKDVLTFKDRAEVQNETSMSYVDLRSRNCVPSLDTKPTPDMRQHLGHTSGCLHTTIFQHYSKKSMSASTQPLRSRWK